MKCVYRLNRNDVNLLGLSSPSATNVYSNVLSISADLKNLIFFKKITFDLTTYSYVD